MGDANTVQGKPSTSDIPFTNKGKTLTVKNKKGKFVQGEVLRVKGSFADILINGKRFLIDSNLKILT